MLSYKHNAELQREVGANYVNKGNKSKRYDIFSKS